MEAFICAIFLDQNMNDTYYSPKMKELDKFRLSGPGWQIVNGFIENLIENCIDFEELVLNEENYRLLIFSLFLFWCLGTAAYMNRTYAPEIDLQKIANEIEIDENLSEKIPEVPLK